MWTCLKKQNFLLNILYLHLPSTFGAGGEMDSEIPHPTHIHTLILKNVENKYHP